MAHNPAPIRSTLPRFVPSSPEIVRAIRKSVSTSNGTLMAKIQRHEALSTICPPTSGPSTAPMPAQAVQAPIARARWSPGKVFTITASAAGVSSAPAAPCRARAATSTSMVGAAAHNTEVTPNPMTPAPNTRRSPKTSPSEPPIRSREPSVSR